MNKRRPVLRKLQTRVTVMFVLMALIFGGLISAYWLMALEPRLRSYAAANASAIAQAQSQGLAAALSTASDQGNWKQLAKAMHSTLLLLDSNTEEPFVLGLSLKLDPDTMNTPAVPEKLEMGDTLCKTCFVTDIPLYSSSTRELLGVATFIGSDLFFQNLKLEISKQFVIGALITLLLVVISWRVFASQIKPLSLLAKSLRNMDISDLTPIEDFSVEVSEEIVLVKKATDDLFDEIHKYIHNLAESKQYTESIISSLQDALLVLDENDLILEINEYGASMVGYTQDELIGQPVDLLVLEIQSLNESGSLNWISVDNTILATNSEARCRHKNGHLIPVLFTRTKRQTTDKFSYSVICTLKDITAFKEAEKIKEINELLEQRVEERTVELRLAQQNALRKERLATVGQLTATVSHELRNPLGTIRNSMYTVEMKVPQGDMRLQKTLSRINRSIQRCDKIIEELLDFTRVKELKPKPTPVDQWLSKMVAEYQSVQAIKIGMQLNSPEYKANLDTERMQRVLINILDNACQSVESAIYAGKKPADMAVTLSTECQDGTLIIACRDTGLGLSEDEIEKVFEPLYSTKNFGVGLGLPLVKQIVENHGGRVVLSSKKGDGALIELFIPLEYVSPS